MPSYLFEDNNQHALERYSLTIADDGTFLWSYGASDASGDMGSSSASGTWKRSGDSYTFTTTEGSDGPKTATLRGTQLEVAGIGTFSET